MAYEHRVLEISERVNEEENSQAQFYGQQFLPEDHYELLFKSFKANRRFWSKQLTPTLLLKKYLQQKNKMPQGNDYCEDSLKDEFPLYNLNVLKDEEANIVWMESEYISTLVQSMYTCYSQLLDTRICYKTLISQLEQFRKCIARNEQWSVITDVEEISTEFDLDQFLMDQQLQHQWNKEYLRYLHLQQLGFNVVPSDYIQVVIGNGVFSQDYDLYEDTLIRYEEVFNEKANPAIWHPVAERHNKGQWISLLRLLYSVIRVVQASYFLDQQQITYYAEKAYSQWNGDALAYDYLYKLQQSTNHNQELKDYRFWQIPIKVRVPEERKSCFSSLFPALLSIGLFIFFATHPELKN